MLERLCANLYIGRAITSAIAESFHAIAIAEEFELDRPGNPPAEELFIGNSPALMAKYNEHLRLVLQGFLAQVSEIHLEYQEPYMVRYTEKRASLDLHTDNSAWSCVVFLNDDFQGGKLVFPSLGVAIQPSAGCCIAFPGGPLYPHYSAEVFDGQKYAIVLMTTVAKCSAVAVDRSRTK